MPQHRDISELASAAWFEFRAKRARHATEGASLLTPATVDLIRRNQFEDVRNMIETVPGFALAVTKENQTALMLACDRREIDLDIVTALLDAGADVNAKDKFGCTALTYAVKGGHIQVVEALLKAGVDINIKNENGLTAIDYAMYDATTKDNPNQTDHLAILERLETHEDQLQTVATIMALTRGNTTHLPMDVMQMLHEERAKRVVKSRSP